MVQEKASIIQERLRRLSLLVLRGAVLVNISLGMSSFHTLYVNRTLLPPELRPNWIMQLGLVATGVFFLAISAVAAFNM